ncbi:hypothetical protein GCM10020218_000580 [Dactylosporangium vinaceum]
MPSAVCFENGHLICGERAVFAGLSEPGAFEPHPKRWIDSDVIHLAGQDFPVVEVIATVLRTVVLKAQDHSTLPLDAAVLTYPTTWGTPRQAVLRAAAERAGLSNVDLIPEATAAAHQILAEYPLAVPNGADYLIFDMGAGTLDIAMLRRSEAGFDVLATGGDDSLGGSDIDEALSKAVEPVLPETAVRQFNNPKTSAEHRNRRAWWETLRRVKESLSQTTSADPVEPFTGSKVRVTRHELESAARRTIDAAVRVAEQTAHGVGRTPTAIFLVGGAAGMPLLHRRLHSAFGTTSAPVASRHVHLAVARGALRASMAEGATVPLPATAPTTSKTLTAVAGMPRGLSPIQQPTVARTTAVTSEPSAQSDGWPEVLDARFVAAPADRLPQRSRWRSNRPALALIFALVLATVAGVLWYIRRAGEHNLDSCSVASETMATKPIDTTIVGPADKAILCHRTSIQVFFSEADRQPSDSVNVLSVCTGPNCYPSVQLQYNGVEVLTVPITLGEDTVKDGSYREHQVRIDRMPIDKAGRLFGDKAGGMKSVDPARLGPAPLSARTYCRWDVRTSPVCGGRTWPSDRPSS